MEGGRGAGVATGLGATAFACTRPLLELTMRRVLKAQHPNVSFVEGVRVSELVGLKTVHLSLTDGALRVTGKGAKERLMPFGEEARA